MKERKGYIFKFGWVKFLKVFNKLLMTLISVNICHICLHHGSVYCQSPVVAGLCEPNVVVVINRAFIN